MAASAARRKRSLYDTDWQAWVVRQEAIARAGRAADLDLVHIAEELRDMGASERRELHSRLITLLMHLLKYQFLPTARSTSWLGTIAEQRIAIEHVLEESPSLRAYLTQTFAAPRTYSNARRRAALETGLARGHFPEKCPYTLENSLDPDFWPGEGPHPA